MNIHIDLFIVTKKIYEYSYWFIRCDSKKNEYSYWRKHRGLNKIAL
jgi:hypothetical protein